MNILGLDPGRDKCGVAVMNSHQEMLYHQIVDSERAIAILQQLADQYDVKLVVIGDGTTSKQWQEQIASCLPSMSIATVNETNSTLEARDRYWLMYPPQGWRKMIPTGLRVPPRPVDDLVAILLIERYLSSEQLRSHPTL